jgi:hypothetical protein
MNKIKIIERFDDISDISDDDIILLEIPDYEKYIILRGSFILSLNIDLKNKCFIDKEQLLEILIHYELEY